VAEHIFKQQTLDGWAFDVEILTIARSCGYEIKEIPISWYYESDSKVNLWSDALKMFSNILIIRKNLVLGVYDDTQRGAN
jgi:dolichyl-phosphate beta-glucosyltransferase